MPDIYPTFIEPKITWVPSGFSGHILLDTIFELNKSKKTIQNSILYLHLQILKHSNNTQQITENASKTRTFI